MDEEAEAGDVIENGWDYWSRVYSDSTLRDELTAMRADDEPTISQLLSGEALKSTRVVIESLPKCFHECDVKSHLEERVGDATIYDVRLRNGRCIVNFYRATDASEAVRLFDGEALRGRLLSVRLEVDAPPPPPPPLVKTVGYAVEPSFDDSGCVTGDGCSARSDSTHSSVPPPPQPPAADPDSYPTYGDADDNLAGYVVAPAGNATSQLDKLLSTAGPLRYEDERIGGIFERAAPTTAAAFAYWPLGVLRCVAELRLVGPFLCRPQDERWAMEKCEAASAPTLCRDDWEPLAPCEIRDQSQLLAYVSAFLRHFGPSWAHGVGLAMFLRAIPSHWRLDVVGVTRCLHASGRFVFLRDTVYLRDEAEHRQAFLRAL